MAEPRFELRPAAGRPYDPDIPDEAAGFIGDDPRARLIGNETAIVADDRVARGIAHRIAARHFDVLDARTRDDCQRRRDGNGHVAADIGIAHALIEVGDIFLVVSGTDPETDRERLAGTRARAHAGAVRNAFVEQVGSGACGGDEIGAVDARIADTVVRVHFDIARARLQRGSGIGGVCLGRKRIVDDRIDHRTALRIHARAAGQRARFHRQDARNDRGIAARHAGDRIRIGAVGLVREIAFVTHRHAAAVVAPGDRGVDPCGKLRVG